MEPAADLAEDGLAAGEASRWRRFLFAAGREWMCSRASGRVLEVGIGDGLNLPLYPQGVQLSGLDIDPDLLAAAKSRAERMGIEVELHDGDAHVIAFPDGSFDTVVGSLILCGVADERVVLAEMARVLAPAGHLLLLDHVASSWPPIRGVQRLIEQVTVPASGEHFTRRPRPLVKELGLEIVEARRSRAGMVECLAARKPA